MLISHKLPQKPTQEAQANDPLSNNWWIFSLLISKQQ